MNLAIQLLQCKPDNFVSQKLDNVSRLYLSALALVA